MIELSRGWMTLPGILNGTFIARDDAPPARHGGATASGCLPRLAAGEIRAAFSMTEPHAGSDVQAIRTTAMRDGDDYVDHRPEDVGHERLARRAS